MRSVSVTQCDPTPHCHREQAGDTVMSINTNNRTTVADTFHHPRNEICFKKTAVLSTSINKKVHHLSHIVMNECSTEIKSITNDTRNQSVMHFFNVSGKYKKNIYVTLKIQ